ncbi:MAG: hypothetical protein MK196_04380 [Acidimicrobiales bacterium]|nr:hypothetical protein [Acidimicrobiales bacterium]
MVATATERIEQAVADGKLGCERADEILAGTEDRAVVQVSGRHLAHRGGSISCHRGYVG